MGATGCAEQRGAALAGSCRAVAVAVASGHPACTAGRGCTQPPPTPRRINSPLSNHECNPPPRARRLASLAPPLCACRRKRACGRWSHGPRRP